MYGESSEKYPDDGAPSPKHDQGTANSASATAFHVVGGDFVETLVRIGSQWYYERKLAKSVSMLGEK
jgi:hypothetical protein